MRFSTKEKAAEKPRLFSGQHIIGDGFAGQGIRPGRGFAPRPASLLRSDFDGQRAWSTRVAAPHFDAVLQTFVLSIHDDEPLSSLRKAQTVALSQLRRLAFVMSDNDGDQTRVTLQPGGNLVESCLVGIPHQLVAFDLGAYGEAGSAIFGSSDSTRTSHSRADSVRACTEACGIDRDAGVSLAG